MSFRESVYKGYMNKTQLIKMLRKEIKKEGTQQAWAKANGITRSFVSEVLLGRKEFSKRILDALGVEIAYVFKKGE